MGVYENLLPGKENALTPEYLTVKCHFSSVRMLQKQIEAERSVPWENENNCRAWSSHDDSALFSLIQADYGLKSRQDFADALKNVSMRNKFHPVRELLDSLTWDGKEHIRSLLPEYLGAEDSDYTYQVRAYVDPTSTDAYKSTAEKYNVESQKLEHINGRLYSSYNKLKNKVEEYRQKNSRLVQVMQNLQKATARVGMVVKNMGSALRSAGSAIKSMVSAMKKAVENMFNLNKQTDRSRMSLSRMLGMSLLFSGVSRAISAVSDGTKSGFENLAQYSNSTNSAISSLMSSMTRLKNSFATAFAPVLTVVAPIMSRFIDMISRAITYVGMFVAALTGQNSFVKAVGVQEDYAAGLEKTSKNTNQAAKNTKKANKETEGYLSALDEIQRYTSNKNDDSAADGNGIGDTGGYTAPTPAQMFKKVPVANSIKGIADKIKKLIKSEDWEGLGKYIASGINKGLKKVYEAISWKKVGPKITKFCNAFTRTFNSLVDHIDWDLMGRTVGAGINTIVNTLNEPVYRVAVPVCA